MTVIDLGGRRPRARRDAKERPRRARLLYQEVIDLVERMVSEQNLRPGDLLPTQTELAERAGVSLITVRRAFDELEREGRVRRHQGLGTFLAQPKIVSEPLATGGLRGTLAAHADPSRLGTNLLGVSRVLPSAALAEALHQRTTDPLWRVRRQRLHGGQPLMIETALIPVELAPDLGERQEQLLGSLYELLATVYGLEDDYEEQFLEVMSPSPEDRRLLRLTPRAQVVRIRGVSADASGRPFDCFEQVYPAANFVFAMSGSASRRLLVDSVTEGWETTPAPEPKPPARARARSARSR